MRRYKRRRARRPITAKALRQDSRALAFLRERAARKTRRVLGNETLRPKRIPAPQSGVHRGNESDLAWLALRRHVLHAPRIGSAIRRGN
jgi:hypothetical protein